MKGPSSAVTGKASPTAPAVSLAKVPVAAGTEPATQNVTWLTFVCPIEYVTHMVTSFPVNFERLGIKDYSGVRFFQITVVEFLGRTFQKNGQCRLDWKCKCDCGNELVLPSYQIGRRKSCGCRVFRNPPNLVHGMYKHPLYGVWMSMKQRCSNPKSLHYADYGGRGIKVCDRWMHSFSNFIQDMGERPSNRYSIERIDVNGDYCPKNCKWDTWSNQTKNQRRWLKRKTLCR